MYLYAGKNTPEKGFRKDMLVYATRIAEKKAASMPDARQFEAAFFISVRQNADPVYWLN